MHELVNVMPELKDFPSTALLFEAEEEKAREKLMNSVVYENEFENRIPYRPPVKSNLIHDEDENHREKISFYKSYRWKWEV